MSTQRQLRAKIANLERMQALRVEQVERRKNEMDDIVEKKQRELSNLKAQLTIGIAR